MATTGGVRVEVEFMGGPADGLVRGYDIPSIASAVTMWVPTKTDSGRRFARYVLPNLDRGAMVPGFRVKARYDCSVKQR